MIAVAHGLKGPFDTNMLICFPPECDKTDVSYFNYVRRQGKEVISLAEQHRIEG